MGFKIWAYCAASLGIIVSLYLFSKKQYKYGCLIMCFSFAVFIGGSLNIGKISGIENSFNAMKENLKQAEKRVDDLDIKITQAISLKQEVTQTVNLVTEVRKEIANIKEAVHQQYAAFKTELFKKADLGKRIATYPNPLSPEKSYVILFELKTIPEENSVQIADDKGMYAPATTFSVTSNVIAVRRTGTSDSYLKDDNEFYVVKYIPDTISDKKMFTIKEPKITAEGDDVKVVYQKK